MKNLKIFKPIQEEPAWVQPLLALLVLLISLDLSRLKLLFSLTASQMWD
jgi:hypothetical protein